MDKVKSMVKQNVFVHIIWRTLRNKCDAVITGESYDSCKINVDYQLDKMSVQCTKFTTKYVYDVIA